MIKICKFSSANVLVHAAARVPSNSGFILFLHFMHSIQELHVYTASVSVVYHYIRQLARFYNSVEQIIKNHYINVFADLVHACSFCFNLRSTENIRDGKKKIKSICQCIQAKIGNQEIRKKNITISIYYFLGPQGQHTYRLLKPGLSILFESGPIRTHVCCVSARSEHVNKQTKTKKRTHKTKQTKNMIFVSQQHQHKNVG